MLEKTIESKHIREVQAEGGKSYKWTSPGLRGVPDRIDLYPIPEEHRAIVNKYVQFTEMKRPKGGVFGLHQKLRFQELQNLGFEPKVRNK